MANNVAVPGNGQFVIALTMDDHGALRPKRCQRLRHVERARRIIHPDQLAAHPRRIGERAEQVEDRPPAERAAYRGDTRHRGMVARGVEKGDADTVEAGPEPVEGQFGNAEFGEHIGGAAA